MENQLYVRIRGRILGPYDQEKLQSLARRGQLGRMHELSADAVNWVQASAYPELFVGQGGPPPMTIQHPGQTASGKRAGPPKMPDSLALSRSRTNRLRLKLAIFASGIVTIALVLSIAFVMPNRDAGVATPSGTAPNTMPGIPDGSQSSDDGANDAAAPAEPEPPQPSIPAILSTGRRYITTVKDHDDLKSAIGLVVVGVEIHSGGKRYESPLGTGSAFAVGSRTGLMLTNKHVVEPFSQLSNHPEWKRAIRRKKEWIVTEKMWVFVAGRKYPASLLYTSPRFDFAMLKIPRPIARTFRLKASPDDLMDEEVRALGFPGNAGIALSEEQLLDQFSRIEVLKPSERVEDAIPVSPDVAELFGSQQLQFVLTRGAICQTPYDEATKTSWLQHTASTAPGSSGGPLVLPNGIVVGINTAISGDPGKHGAQFSLAISVGQLREEIGRFITEDIWTP
jgi:S1-C subfamily serine protease